MERNYERKSPAISTCRVKVQFHGRTSTLMLFVVLGLYLYASLRLMAGPDFNDETEKLIASQLMQNGLRLYKDIFVQHGPFVYMLSHLFDVLTGNTELYWPRVLPIGLSLVSVMAIAGSPALENTQHRLTAAALTLVAYSFLLAQFSLIMTMYQVYAGFLFVIALALAIVPSALGLRLRPWQLLCSGFALVCVGLNAFSYGPALFLVVVGLFASRLPDWREGMRVLGWTALGGFIALAIVAAWMALYGDWIGYFVYHIYFNIKFYGPYLHGSNFLFVKFLIIPLYSFLPGWIWFLAPNDYSWYDTVLFGLPLVASVLLYLVGTTSGMRRGKMFIFIVTLLYLSLLYMNPRLASGSGASTFVIIASASAMLMVTVALDRFVHVALAVLVATSVMAAGVAAQLSLPTKLYELSVLKYYNTKGPLFQRKTSEFTLAREIVTLDDGVSQAPFDLNIYVWLGRRPQSGIFFWLPWMADYEKKPVRGYPLDFCENLASNPPKLFYFHDDAIWGYATDRWMGCVKTLLSRHYVKAPALGPTGWGWVRSDIAGARQELLKSAIVTTDLDLSGLNPEAAAALSAAKLDFIRLGQSGLCLADDQIPETNDAVTAQDCSKALRLGVRPTENREAELVSLTTGQCLEVIGASQEVGAQLRLWSCMSAPNQKFFVSHLPSGRVEVRNVLSRMCVSLRGKEVSQQVCDDTTHIAIVPEQ
jgi:MFS family permease